MHHVYRSVADESFADLHRVEGLRGIYIASQVLDQNIPNNIGPEHLITLISYDRGGEWRRIKAPRYDNDNTPIKCEEVLYNILSFHGLNLAVLMIC
jgi:hypothetical protein